jgi:hypothetical protein
VIPQALYFMKDIRLLRQHRNSTIFHKTWIKTSEILSSHASCFIYIESGVEVITNEHHEAIGLPGVKNWVTVRLGGD